MTEGNILVVDDTPDNLRLLSVMLAQRGYQVRKALNGKTAIATVSKRPPDVILLDINMPGENGYEVCARLKADPETADIPVIFISALDDVLDKVKAFDVGGVDYISKPFQEEEVIIRIDNQLTIRRQQAALNRQNTQLQTEIAERTKAESALRVFLHAVSHDLRNPVTAMSLVLKNFKAAGQDPIKLPLYILERMELSCDRQLDLINSLVETQQLEIWGVALQCEPVELHALTQQLCEEWEPRLIEADAQIINKVPTDLPLVQADAHQLWRVYENLIANALKHNPPGVTLTLTAAIAENNSTLRPCQCQDSGEKPARAMRCQVIDDGVGMPTEQVKTLFDPYQRGREARRTLGLGLGLYLCRQIIEAHGGKISAQSAPQAGTKFEFSLAIAE